ncbi:MAG: SDR family NAD(P)-dependent oxidoreductase [Alphaproteobacteria bacterium]
MSRSVIENEPCREKITAAKTKVSTIKPASSHASNHVVLVGVGPGLGIALAEKFSAEGMSISIFNRNIDLLKDIINKSHCRAENVHSYACDATDERDFRKALAAVVSRRGTPDIVIYLAQGFNPGTVLDTEVAVFEDNWRANCLGAFIVGKFTAELMARRNSGTIIFAGATSGTVGRAGYVNLAIGKFGLRALSQVMARELWPKGIHVAHVVIDADVAESPLGAHPTSEGVAMDPMDAAEVFYGLHKQPKSAWSQEIDLRPWNERFWKHC